MTRTDLARLIFISPAAAVITVRQQLLPARQGGGQLPPFSALAIAEETNMVERVIATAASSRTDRSSSNQYGPQAVVPPIRRLLRQQCCQLLPARATSPSAPRTSTSAPSAACPFYISAVAVRILAAHPGHHRRHRPRHGGGTFSLEGGTGKAFHHPLAPVHRRRMGRTAGGYWWNRHTVTSPLTRGDRGGCSTPAQSLAPSTTSPARRS
jgi:hypothetical protein